MMTLNKNDDYDYVMNDNDDYDYVMNDNDDYDYDDIEQKWWLWLCYERDLHGTTLTTPAGTPAFSQMAAFRWSSSWSWYWWYLILIR